MKRERSRTRAGVSLALALLLLAGLSLLLYPTLSNYWNSRHQSRLIASYTERIAALDDGAYAAMYAQAQAYNAALPQDASRFQPSEEDRATYTGLLNASGTGIMGVVEIPSIGVQLPIYHGTDGEVLQIAIGHIQGSSLPVGGAGTHCVISGHRGLPSAKLFTDLDQLALGDVFLLHVLDQTLTYEVDQIRIVEPQDVSLLAIEAGEDLCTLLTCTPYGVNTHRLLVRGHRVANGAEAVSAHVTADAVQIDPKLVAPVLAAPILLILLLWAMCKPVRRRESYDIER